MVQFYAWSLLLYTPHNILHLFIIVPIVYFFVHITKKENKLQQFFERPQTFQKWKINITGQFYFGTLQVPIKLGRTCVVLQQFYLFTPIIQKWYGNQGKKRKEILLHKT